MNLISEIINDFKKCIIRCCPSLFHSPNLHQTDTLQQQLVELEQRTTNKFLSPPRTKSRKPSGSYRQTKSLQDQHQQQDKIIVTNMVQSSQPKRSKRQHIFQLVKNQHQQHSINQKPVIIRQIQSSQSIAYQRRSSSQSSFQTLKSSASRPLSRRNFKILRKSSSFYAKHRSKNDDDFYSVNQSQQDSANNSTPKQQRILTFKFTQNNESHRDGIDLMNIWMKRQYQAHPITGRLYKPALSQITKMKLHTKDLFDTLVHKLQDYYTFYFQDQQHFQQPMNLSRSMSKHYEQQMGDNQHQQSFTYEENNHQMVCSVSKQDAGGVKQQDMGEFNGCKYISLIIIPHCTLPPLAFLQWFNKLQVQSSLHCFNKIQYIPDSQIVDDKLSLQYPLVRVEQFNEKLIGKQTFILARQIQVAKFENEEDKETLLEVCFEVADDEKCFERLVRVTAEPNDGSRAEIYIQSSENIARRRVQELMKAPKPSEQSTKSYEFGYFQQRWKRFQQKLNKGQVINKKAINVFTN